ncbi:hypothetical protein DF133_13175 [Burkholderia cenocepacia]|nr:hypothetical protein DF133_13175 [Burkholderia cenocepacia]
MHSTNSLTIRPIQAHIRAQISVSAMRLISIESPFFRPKLFLELFQKFFQVGVPLPEKLPPAIS